MTNLFRTISFLLAAINFVAACMPAAPTNVYTGSQCNPPCWNQIIPGQSTNAEVQTFLSTLSIVDQRSAHNVDRPESQNIFRHYRVLTDGGEVTVDVQNDKVIAISIRDHSAETIADLIAQVGPPEYVFGDYAGAENVKLYIYLLYPSKGALYEVIEQPQSSTLNSVDRVESTMFVSGAAFVAPGTISSMFADLGQNEDRAQCILNNMQPWKGYGLIRVVPISRSC